MDGINSAVLRKINSLTPLNRYVIISEDEFEEIADGEKLDASLTALRDEGYIDVRYSRGNMYCVAPLKEFYEVPEEDGEEEQFIEEKKPRFNRTFLSAFFGGALGSLIISLIFAVI